MSTHKFPNLILSILMVASLLLGGVTQVSAQRGQDPLTVGNKNVTAAPASSTDATKVPHYFGPWPNWANSPFTLPDATVEIVNMGSSNGSGAAAVAVVGANGAITDIIMTNPGHNYTNVQVNILGSGTGADAVATIVKKGAVVAVTVNPGGSGYTAPVVTFGGNRGAAGTAYGGVDAIAFTNGGGFGYQFPTIDFDMPDGPNGMQAKAHAEMDANGTIIAVVIDNPGSGYSTAPGVVIRDGTQFDPINHDPGTFEAATVTDTLSIQSVVLDSFGAGYNQAPTVAITDTTGSGAVATAALDNGIISAIAVKKPGSGYLTTGGIQKFTDQLPGVCNPPACPSYLNDPVGGPKAKYIPLAIPEIKTYSGVEADEYVIGLVQYRTSFTSSLPDTLVRGYIQLETAANAGISQHFPVTNELLDGTQVPVMQSDAVTQWLAVTPPQYLGPIIAATKNRPVRIVFYNLLPTGSDGDLFLPTDSSMMGSGMGPDGMAMDSMDEGSVMDSVRNPVCSEYPKDTMNCFADNRATLHLHGGISPWISDGTPHQWITPAGENTRWPEGVSVSNVPDMDVCNAADDGCQTFYYTNQQSARLMFYHDHAWGITRLNVYAGEAAGYLITDDTEQALLNSGTIPTDQIPLIIQDKTFVPDAAQLALQDPTWDATRWGSKGSFWYHHVYMPAQNPGDPSGMSAYGRWMYGPWFWPPALNTVHGPIANPYYDLNCNLDDPTTWLYDTDPFCEPEQIPGTPNISVGMEQFNDTPTVNGVAYPTLTLEPKAYRFRILSVANDRFFNFQWYVADPGTASTSLNTLGEIIGGTEVALNPAELAAAQLDPNIFPTPVQSAATAGPDWIQIGTEGGFLPAPVVVDGQQPTTWITDPTRFDVGNVDQHSLLLAPAERADVIVDFSQFAGQTLILYNDAPAAFPARVASYDYYTGAPDLSPVGAPTILPGYGPNTRTIMQIKIASVPAAPAFNLSQLQAAFRHNANGTGVFESGQHPIIVGQAAYNSAYGTSFASGSNCNTPSSTVQRCDGYVRVNDTQQFGFNTLLAPSTKMTLPLQPKAIHDEMNASTFDEFGRMTANLGVEAQPPVPGAQNVVLYPYVNPATELIDATNLPKNVVLYDANGQVVSDVKITPISDAADGTQIWRITHNGVDTHPIHFHLYDVQLVNRVTWDNIIIPPDATELGWKDTVRIAPLEDTIVALRPIIPQVPFEVPNAVRPLNPMMPLGSTAMFNPIDPQGNPTAAIVNQLVNFGWEYVFHCHILSHEEMDMMRPVSVVMPPNSPDGLVFDASTGTLTWNDNSITETAFRVERSADGGTTWDTFAGWTISSPLDQPNVHEVRSLTDTVFDPNLSYLYRVVALNTVGYLDGNDPLIAGFPEMTVQSVSEPLAYDPAAAPVASVLSAAYQPDSQIVLTWSDLSNETGYIVEKSTDGVNFSQIAALGADVTTYTDAPVDFDSLYYYQVYAFNDLGNSPMSNVATVATPPTAPTDLMGTYRDRLNVALNWTDTSTYEDGFIIERIDGDVTSTFTVGPNVTSYKDTGAAFDAQYVYQVYAFNASGSSAASNQATVDIPPFAPNNLTAAYQAGPQVLLTWFDNSEAETGFIIERCTGAGCVDFVQVGTLGLLNGIGTVTYTDTTVALDTAYRYRVAAVGAGGLSDYSNIFDITTSVQTIPVAPSNLSATNVTQISLTLNWQDNSANEAGFTIQFATNTGFTANLQTFTVDPNVNSLPFSGLTGNMRYYFRVAAYNTAGSSPWSRSLNVKTPR